ncbi:MAG: DUF5011 domain-containing protein, partial [Nitrosopumilus sp.]|nr:DUF5011 domain-containing protein [Nitrosopumilus sp.]
MLDGTAPVLVLDPPLHQIVPVGGAYEEPAASCGDGDRDLEVDKVVTVPRSGSTATVPEVDTSRTGTYTITYDCMDPSGNRPGDTNATTSRTVQVLAPPSIRLVGAAAISLDQYEPYREMNATCTDANGPLRVGIEGEVDTTTVDRYDLRYSCTGLAGTTSSINRTVSVGDTEPPVISLDVPPVEFVRINGDYRAPQATCTDALDGGRSVTTGGDTVDTASYGRYDVTYDCSDTAGNDAIQRSRAVYVVPAPSNHTYAGSSAQSRCASYGSSGWEIAVDGPGDLYVSATVASPLSANVTHFAVTSGDATVGVYDYLADVSGGSMTAHFLVPSTITSKIAGDPASADFAVDVIVHSHPASPTGPGKVYTIPNVTAADALSFHSPGRYIILDGDSDVPGGAYTGNGTLFRPNGTTADPPAFDSNMLTHCVLGSSSNAGSSVRIDITGDDPHTLTAGSAYVERGAMCVFGDGTTSAARITSPRVLTQVPGTFEVSYVCTDGSGVQITKSREVRVVASDTTPPVVSITGANPYHLANGTAFKDPGAVCEDDVDADRPAPPASAFSETGIGNYTIRYMCTDEAGNDSKTYNRTVTIRPAPTITLEGGAAEHQVGDPAYVDPGAACVSAGGAELPVFAEVAGGSTLVRSGADAYNRTLAGHVTTGTPGTYKVPFVCVDDHAEACSAIRPGEYECTPGLGVMARSERTVTVSELVGYKIKFGVSNPYHVVKDSAYRAPPVECSTPFGSGSEFPGTVFFAGTPDTSVVGRYNVTYTCSLNGAIQDAQDLLVIVSRAEDPVLVLVGRDPMTAVKETFEDPGATCTDEADPDRVVYSDVDVDDATAGTHTLTYECTDTSGRDAAPLTRTVNIIDADTTAPEVQVRGDASPTIPQDSEYVELGANCRDDVDDDKDAEVIGKPDTSKTGEYTVQYRCTDEAGNGPRGDIREVTVDDRQNPIITLNGDSTVRHAFGTTYNDASATCRDNSDPDPRLTITDNVNGFVLGTYFVTYECVDGSRNEARGEVRTVHVVDMADPVISLNGEDEVLLAPGSVYRELGASCTDGLDGDLPVTIGGEQVLPAIPDTYTVAYTCVDAAGNDDDAVRTVRVLDRVKPEITLAGQEMVESTFNATYVDEGARCIDVQDGTLDPKIDASMVDVNKLGAYTVTITCSDSAGNPADPATRTVTIVMDATPPVITFNGPSIIRQEVGPYEDPGSTCTDPVFETVHEVTHNGTDVQAAADTYVVVHECTDKSDNRAERARTVILGPVPFDASLPVISLRGGAVVHTVLGGNYADEGATCTDIEGGAIDAVSTIIRRGATEVTGISGGKAATYTFTYDCEDGAGNRASDNRGAERSRTVHVLSPPVVTIDEPEVEVEKGGTYVEDGASCSNLLGSLPAASITGAVNTSAPDFYPITYECTGQAGQSSFATRQVRVLDAGAPSITVAGASPAYVAFNSTYRDAGASCIDGEEGFIQPSSNASRIDTRVLGDQVVGYECADTSGNKAAPKHRVVTVIPADPNLPVITINPPNPARVLEHRNYTDAGATCTDAQDGSLPVTVGGDIINTTVPGAYQVTYSCSDLAGNRAADGRTVNVVRDTAKPVIKIIGGTGILVDLNADYVDMNATCADNGLDGLPDTDLPVSSFDNVDTSRQGIYTVTYTCTDMSGNRADPDTRTVIVDIGAADYVSPFVDRDGDRVVYVPLDGRFTDEGASCTEFFNLVGHPASTFYSSVITDYLTEIQFSDSLPGIGTESFAPADEVDTSVQGTYRITYDCIGAEGGSLAAATSQLLHNRQRDVVVIGPPTLTVDGSSETVTAFLPYERPGAACTGPLGEIDVVETGAVFVSIPDVYDLVYTCTDPAGQVAREVLQIEVAADRDRPVITRTGGSVIYQPLGEAYEEPGVKCVDPSEGPLTHTTDGLPVMDVVGTYPLVYSCSDGTGNTATAGRTVHVADPVPRDSTPPVIRLNGPSFTLVGLGADYEDPGVACTDNQSGDIDIVASSIDIIRDGTVVELGSADPVDTSATGTYIIRYDCIDGAGNRASDDRSAARSRSVEVVDRPVITLLGSANAAAFQGINYPDPGATCTGSGTPPYAEITMRANTSMVGTFNTTYACTDTAGQTVHASRMVQVQHNTNKIPVLLHGEHSPTVQSDNGYADPGATCVDPVLGVYAAKLTGRTFVRGEVLPDFAIFRLSYDCDRPGDDVAPAIQSDRAERAVTSADGFKDPVAVVTASGEDDALVLARHSSPDIGSITCSSSVHG